MRSKSRDRLFAFKALVTKWVQTTTMGYRVWLDSSGTLNVGDLLCEMQALEELRKLLPHQGITSLELRALEGSEVGAYDQLLVFPDQIRMPKQKAGQRQLAAAGLSKDQKLDLIAEQLDYGLRWLEDNEISQARCQAVETLAHQAACCLYQWFKPGEGVATSETCDALDLHKFPERKILRKSLELYLEDLLRS